MGGCGFGNFSADGSLPKIHLIFYSLYIVDNNDHIEFEEFCVQYNALYPICELGAERASVIASSNNNKNASMQYAIWVMYSPMALYCIIRLEQFPFGNNKTRQD